MAVSVDFKSVGGGVSTSNDDLCTQLREFLLIDDHSRLQCSGLVGCLTFVVPLSRLEWG